jgi:hypothetical protein
LRLKPSQIGVSELSTILGLPELPFEPPQRPATMSLATFDADDEDNNEVAIFSLFCRP